MDVDFEPQRLGEYLRWIREPHNTPLGSGSKEPSGSSSKKKHSHSSPDSDFSPKRHRHPETGSEERAEQGDSLTAGRMMRISRRKISSTQDGPFVSWENVPEAQVSLRLSDEDGDVIRTNDAPLQKKGEEKLISREENEAERMKKESEIEERQPHSNGNMESSLKTGPVLTTPDPPASPSSWISDTDDASIERKHQKAKETEEIFNRLEDKLKQRMRKISKLIPGEDRGKLRECVIGFQEDLGWAKAECVSVAGK